MEGARALLDSLMGQTRDMNLKDAKKKKGNNFKEENICKFHLLGFCPQHEDLFKNTKKGHLQLGECHQIHSEACKNEFEAHPEKADYERTYARDLLRYLEGITRKADDAVARQSSKLEAKSLELFGDVAKREIQAVRDQAAAYLAQAEECAESGDILGCKAKRELYDETIKRAEDYETKAKEEKPLEFCTVCGLRLEQADEVHGVQVYDHNQGRVHLGFVKIREWIATLKKRIDELEEERKKKRDERREDSSRKDESRGADRGEVSKQNPRERDRGDNNRKEERAGDRGDNNRREERGGDRGDNNRREERGGDRGDNNRREERGGDRDSNGNREYSDRDGNRRRERDYGDRDTYRRENRGREQGREQDYYDRNDPKREVRQEGYGYRESDDRSYDRRGNRGRDMDRGYDDGYSRIRSRSGMRRR